MGFEKNWKKDLSMMSSLFHRVKVSDLFWPALPALARRDDVLNKGY
jgi:hypothetical protein